jgi:RHS repeat-associated protein
MAYDATQGLLPTSVLDSNSQTTGISYSYDSSGNPIVQIKDPGETGSYTQQGTLKTSCSDSSVYPCQELDSNSLLYSSAVTQTFYDSLGRSVETLTPGSDSTHTTVTFTVYDDAAHTVFTSVPFVVASRTTWLDPNGATDINGAAPGGTTTALDALGRDLTNTDPLSHVTTSSYGIGTSGVSGDSNSYAITTTVDANSHASKSYDDAFGRTIYAVDYSGLSTGTPTAVKRTTTAYNVLGKATSVAVTDLAPQTGQTITTVTTTATYDALGRVTARTDPDYGTSAYTYNADSRQLTEVSGSHTVGTSYDLLGRARCLQDAAPTVDGSGACSSGSHPLVQTTYDTSVLGVQGTTDFAVGQLTQSVATTYFPDGTSASVTEQYQHDQRGQGVAETLQLTLPGGWNITNALPTYEMTQAYNDAGQPTTTQTLVGSQTGYTFTQVYDGTTGRLTGLSNNSVASANLATLAYDNHSQVSDINFLTSTGGALANEHFTYDGNLRVAGANGTWQSGSGSSGTVFSESLAYDAIGNVISKLTTLGGVSGQSNTGGSQTENFCYDEADRLIWAGNNGSQPASGSGTCGASGLTNTLSGNGYNTSFSYINLGQIWQGPLNGNGAQEQYLYCDSSHPHQLTGLYPIGTTCSTVSSATAAYSASYDAWGNEVSRAYGGTADTLSYDVLNQLTQWNAGSSNQDWYVYDASGSRVLQRFTSSSATSLTVYAFGLQELHYDGSGNSQDSTCYFSLGGHLLGALVYGNMQFYLTDTEGSVLTTFSNVAGSAVILGNQVYSPYGTKGYNAGSMGTSKGYTGQYADPTGLDYYNARYYDPVVGRFLSVDSVEGNAQGTDPYNYVGGNPESRTDPSGQRMLGPNGTTGWISGGTLYTSSSGSGVHSQPIYQPQPRPQPQRYPSPPHVQQPQPQRYPSPPHVQQPQPQRYLAPPRPPGCCSGGGGTMNHSQSGSSPSSNQASARLSGSSQSLRSLVIPAGGVSNPFSGTASHGLSYQSSSFSVPPDPALDWLAGLTQNELTNLIAWFLGKHLDNEFMSTAVDAEGGMASFPFDGVQIALAPMNSFDSGPCCSNRDRKSKGGGSGGPPVPPLAPPEFLIEGAFPQSPQQDQGLPWPGLLGPDI